MKTVAIIQARLTSTRFPKKVLQPFIGTKTVLQTVIDKVSKATRLHQVIVATPHPIDFMGAEKFIFNGDENDVLSRYYLCAKDNQADTIVRITADCPLISPQIIDGAVNLFCELPVPYVIFAPVSGLDVEVFSFRILEEAYKNAQTPYDREHVTPYMQRASDISVNTPEELEKARRYYGYLRNTR